MKIAVCCAMNQNRSMSIHDIFLKNGYNITSYGTSDEIKIPDESPKTPNIYPYTCSYNEIIDDLKRKNEYFYTKRGIIKMLERNMAIKKHPEWFFNEFRSEGNENIPEIVICCDRRCFDRIFNVYRKNPGQYTSIMLCFDINDTIADAESDAKDVLKFIKTVEISLGKVKDMKDGIEEGMEFYLKKYKKSILFAPIKL